MADVLDGRRPFSFPGAGLVSDKKEKQAMTQEELREIRIVELAYEMQLEDDDDESGDGSLKDEYYQMAKREIEGEA